MARTTLHIVGGESRARAEQAQAAFALGQHAEVYATIEELLDCAPSVGVILAAQTNYTGSVSELINLLGNNGIWLPVIVTSSAVVLEEVVAAIRGGALDYISLPLEISTFAGRLQSIIEQAEPYIERRRLQIRAAHRVGRLSPRERQVLELLTSGLQNKDIAETLRISPRTVEIHRSKMMNKLGASHPAEAVKAWLAAQAGETYQSEIAQEIQRPSSRAASPATASRVNIELIRKVS